MPAPPPYPDCTLTLLPGAAAEQALRAVLLPSALGPRLGAAPRLELALVSLRAPAGFASPAADFDCDRVDLLQHLELDQPYVFMARVRGQSMSGRGIDDGDLLVINRKISPRHGHIVVALIDNELTCKTLHQQGGALKLVAANPDFPDIVAREGQDLLLWGVVTSCIKSFGA